MATSWSVASDATLNEATEWTLVITQTSFFDETEIWRVKPAPLDPNAAPANTLLNFGGWAAEDFAVIPEDVNVVPEVVQNDATEWTIQAEPV